MWFTKEKASNIFKAQRGKLGINTKYIVSLKAINFDPKNA